MSIRKQQLINQITAAIAELRDISSDPVKIKMGGGELFLEIMPSADGDRAYLGRNGWGCVSVNFTHEGLVLDVYSADMSELEPISTSCIYAEDLMLNAHLNGDSTSGENTEERVSFVHCGINSDAYQLNSLGPVDFSAHTTKVFSLMYLSEYSLGTLLHPLISCEWHAKAMEALSPISLCGTLSAESEMTFLQLITASGLFSDVSCLKLNDVTIPVDVRETLFDELFQELSSGIGSFTVHDLMQSSPLGSSGWLLPDGTEFWFRSMMDEAIVQNHLIKLRIAQAKRFTELATIFDAETDISPELLENNQSVKEAIVACCLNNDEIFKKVIEQPATFGRLFDLFAGDVQKTKIEFNEHFQSEPVLI